MSDDPMTRDRADAAGHPHDDAAAYAIGALDAAERAAFEAHLATCAACAAEVRRYGDVAVALARGVSGGGRETPSSALRARILAEAAATPQAGAPTTTAAGVVDAAAGPRLALVDRDASVESARAIRPRTATSAMRAVAPPRRATPWTPWLAAAASLVLAAGLGAGWSRERAAALAARGESERARQQVADADARRAAADAELRRATAERDTLLAALTAPDVRVARLAVAGEPAAMRLTWNRERGIVVLTASGMPQPHAGKTYQLWGIARGSAPQSLGVFAPGADGGVRAVLRVPREAEMQLAAVTEEAAGGVPHPRGEVLMIGGLAGARQ